MVEMSHPCLAQLLQYQAEPRCVSLSCALGAFSEQTPTSRLGYSAPEPGWQGSSTEDWGKRLGTIPGRGAPGNGCWRDHEMLAGL